MIRVGVFVGTRADLGPLEPVMDALAADPEIELIALCGLAFTATELRERLASDRTRGAVAIHALAAPLERIDAYELLAYGAQLVDGMTQVLSHVQLDTLVVLGDRWELLFVGSAAFLVGVPLVHLHGGEVTEGALDDRVRHALSKLADVHCVASEDARRRLLQLGEQDERVHVTGAPGLDRMADVAAASVDDLVRILGVAPASPWAIFTYHPATAVQDAPLATWVREALMATLEHCASVVVTHPGMDPGRDVVLLVLEQMAETDERIILVSALGDDYPRVLAAADVVVGNSSSGVIEAGILGLPVVDIGPRQAGRLRGANVLHADDGMSEVSEAVRRALTPEFRSVAHVAGSPYGDGHSSPRIVTAVRSAVKMNRAKAFVDRRLRAAPTVEEVDGI